MSNIIEHIHDFANAICRETASGLQEVVLPKNVWMMAVGEHPGLERHISIDFMFKISGPTGEIIVRMDPKAAEKIRRGMLEGRELAFFSSWSPSLKGISDDIRPEDDSGVIIRTLVDEKTPPPEGT